MTGRSVVHATFCIERVYDAAPERVFAAYASKEAKGQWFKEPEGWEQEPHELDFREGGRERAGGRPPGGAFYRYDAVFWEIVPNERIVSTYEMLADGVRISVSVATTELKREGTKTRLVYTEQGAFLDGLDTPAQREAGTRDLLDALGKIVERAVQEA